MELYLNQWFEFFRCFFDGAPGVFRSPGGVFYFSCSVGSASVREFRGGSCLLEALLGFAFLLLSRLRLGVSFFLRCYGSLLPGASFAKQALRIMQRVFRRSYSFLTCRFKPALLADRHLL